MPTYEIEVQRTIATTVDVTAETPDAALEAVNKSDFALPPRQEWNGMKDWEYVIVTVDGEPYDENDD